MANKTSARSKGYRKTVQKKPFLTPKEIKALIGIVLAIILAIVLFNLFYDDGSLDIKDGQVVAKNLENSVIFNSGTGDHPKYYKIGEIGEIDGFTRELYVNSADALARRYIFTPTDAENPISKITVGGSMIAPAQLASSVQSQRTGGLYTTSSIHEHPVGERPVYLLYTDYSDTDEETGVFTYHRTYNVYTDGAAKGSSLTTYLDLAAESPEALEGEALAAFIEENIPGEDAIMAQLESVYASLNTDSSK